MLMGILHFNASKEKENISLFCLYLELVPAREDRLWEAGKKKVFRVFWGLFRVFRGCSRFFGCSGLFRDVPVPFRLYGEQERLTRTSS